MRRYLEIVAGIFMIGCPGCARHEKIEAHEVESAFILNSSSTFKGYFYQGSDASYHYFTSRWAPGKDKHFKLPLDRLTVKHPYKFGVGDGAVRIDLLGQENDLFGYNGFYKLYVAGDVP